MQRSNLETIKQCIGHCRTVLAKRPEYMSEKEQEPLAAQIVGLYGLAHLEESEKAYPQLTEILDISSNLEFSNVDNTTIAWRRIKQLVDELERQVKR